MQLYQKVPHGKTFRYVPAEVDIPGEGVTIHYNLNERQALTAAGSLGVVLLSLFERNIDPKKLVFRKIKAVEDAILDLYKGTGQEIDDEVADAMCRAWDKAMHLIAAEDGI